MKKRILSILLVFVMLVQIAPLTFAAEDTNVKKISKVEEFMALNDDLDASVELQNDIQIVVNADFIKKYKATGVGSKDKPFTGKINGNGYKIRYNVSKDVPTQYSDFAPFGYLKGVTITNLSLSLYVEHEIYDSRKDINIGALAIYADGCNITLQDIVFESGTDKNYKTKLEYVSNVRLGTVIYTKGEGTIMFYKCRQGSGIALHNSSNIIQGGIVAEVLDGTTNIYQTYHGDQEDSFQITTNAAYTVGGLVGIVNKNATLNTSASHRVEIFVGHENRDGSGKEKETSKQILVGGQVAWVKEGGTFNSMGTSDASEVVLHHSSPNIIASGGVAKNDGTVNLRGTYALYNNNHTVIQLVRKGTIILAPTLGQNNGTAFIISSGNNLKIVTTFEVPADTLYIGGIIGQDNGKRTDIIDNGISFIMTEDTERIKNDGRKKTDNIGFIVGKTTTPKNMTVEFNIVNATDFSSFESDYSWVQSTLGTTSKSSVLKSFDSNYYGSMSYTELNVPTQIYHTKPIVEFGNKPCEENYPNFPFEFRYTSFNAENDDDYNFISFIDGKDGNVGSVLLTKDCKIGVRTHIDIRPQFNKNNYSGHVYSNPDILNYTATHPEEPGEPGEPGEPDPLPNVHFMQAFAVGEIGEGTPLPVYYMGNSNHGEVNFNLYNLPYEWREMNMSFTDIYNSRYNLDILMAANRGIVNGVGGGLFQPNRSITRAEFATMAVRALGLIPIGEPKFVDVSPDAWYYEYVNTAASWGIIAGVGNDMFMPESPITREEAMAILVRVSKNILMQNGFYFTFQTDNNWYDVSDASDWAQPEIREAMQWRLVEMRSGAIYPKEYITRDETANAFLNLLRGFGVIDNNYNF